MGTALVLGCGGTLGFAWTAEMLAEFERRGWDPRAADVIVGTSAGAELGAMLGAGIPATAIAEVTDPWVIAHLTSPRAPGAMPGLPRPSLPGLGLTRAALRRRADTLAALAGLLPRGSANADWLVDLGDALAGEAGWVAHPDTWLVAADAATGERVPFGRAGSPTADLGQAIAASWAIPGWFPPVRIGGRNYLDGGAVSPTSADLLVPLVRDGRIDRVLIVAPMSSHGGAPARGLSHLERLLRRPMTSRVDREVAALEGAGAHVTRIEPSVDDLAAMGPNFMDGSRLDAVHAASRRTATAVVSEHITDWEAIR